MILSFLFLLRFVNELKLHYLANDFEWQAFYSIVIIIKVIVIANVIIILT